MRIIAILVSFLVYFNAFAAAPLGVVGQNQTTKLYPAVVKTPNSQTTDLGSATALIETGNKNRLVNPGFEGSISAFSIPGWSSSVTGTAVITYTAETSTYLIEGKKSNIIGCSGGISGGTCTFYQDVTTNQAVQALASIYVNSSSATGVKVFSRVNGANYQSVDVTQALQTGLYKVPVVAGTTSTGIAVQFTVSAGQSIQAVVDEAFVGAVDLKVDTNNISNWTTFTPTGTWTGNTTYTGRWRRVGNIAEIQYKAKTSALPTPAVALEFDIPASIGVFDHNSVQLDDAGSFYTKADGEVYDVGLKRYAIEAYIFSGSRSKISVYQPSTNTGTNPVALVQGSNPVQPTSPISFGSNDEVNITIRIPIVGWASSGSIYSSTNADTSLAEYTPTFNSGFSVGTGGNASSKFWWYRDGQYMVISGGWRLGSSGASIGTGNHSITIPSGYSIDTSKLTLLDGYPNVGTVRIGDFSAGAERVASILVFNSSSNTLFIGNGANFNGITSTTPWTWAQDDFLSIEEIRVPIVGWENSNIIIGQFNGLESCTDTYQCTDTYTAKIDASGVVTSENIEWITGNASIASTSQYTLTFKTGLFTQAPNCTVSLIDGASSGILRVFAISSSSVSVFTESTTPAAAARAFGIICQKQGADFIGKTAKAVASDQNVRSVGSVGVDIQSVYFGGNATCSTACTTGNCTICNPVGTKITSVSFLATGQYKLNGIDGTKYNCTGNSYNIGVGPASLLHVRDSSTSSYALIYTYNSSTFAATNTGYNSVTCIGIP